MVLVAIVRYQILVYYWYCVHMNEIGLSDHKDVELDVDSAVEEGLQ